VTGVLAGKLEARRVGSILVSHQPRAEHSVPGRVTNGAIPQRDGRSRFKHAM
jgi:hypothetical protein